MVGVKAVSVVVFAGVDTSATWHDQPAFAVEFMLITSVVAVPPVPH